ncbi:11148_t:CDS:1 [Funneliformis mosseae]|uniref:11148_t:CDS:1 n=1 Tax=Funneliformis mosseae TaxID=27381 RepID=A0A9N8V4G4_FUNMO|nr:11148_t:CDS:1 [Funneliformis mosseae]
MSELKNNLDYFTVDKIITLRRGKYKTDIDNAIQSLKYEIDNNDMEIYVIKYSKNVERNRDGKIKRPSNSNILYTNTLNKHLDQVVEKICEDHQVKRCMKMPLGKKFSKIIWEELKEEQKYTDFFKELATKIKEAHAKKNPGYVYKPNRNKNKHTIIKQYRPKNDDHLPRETKNSSSTAHLHAQSITIAPNDCVDNPQQMESAQAQVMPQESMNKSSKAHLQSQRFNISPNDHDDSQLMEIAQAQVMTNESMNNSNAHLQSQRFNISNDHVRQMSSAQVQIMSHNFSNTNLQSQSFNHVDHSQQMNGAQVQVMSHESMNNSSNTHLQAQGNDHIGTTQRTYVNGQGVYDSENILDEPILPEFNEKTIPKELYVKPFSIHNDILMQQYPFDDHQGEYNHLNGNDLFIPNYS